MKRRVLLTLATLSLSGVAFAQQSTAQQTTAQANSTSTTQLPGPHGYIRCGTPGLPLGGIRNNPPGDCSATSTNPTSQYSPANRDVVEITVVFHVIRTNAGSGDVPNSRLMSQIDIFNEDFRAMAGTPGAPGTDTGIQFVLATTDPGGGSTNGINRYNNSTWFGDAGGYWNSIAWDPTRYLNVYTLGQPMGNPNVLGYVPFIPQLNPAAIGSLQDRVVLLNGTVGRNAPLAPFNQGRTGVHEVGHYLGLYHTFEGGCGSAACYTSGDRICDTNAESGPEFNCSVGSVSCGSTDPVRNYMNYSVDACMTNFTEEQARRMRCTLEFWRPTIAVPLAPVLGDLYCSPAVPNSTGNPATLLGSGTKQIANNDFALTAIQLPTNSTGYFVTSMTQGFVFNAGGSQGNLCIGGNIGRYVSQIGNSGLFGQLPLVVDVNNMPQPMGSVVVQPGQTWNFQCWYRDANPSVTSNFSDGYTITFE